MPVQNLKSRVSWKSKKKGDDELDVIVLASGNLCMIYFTKWADRMSMEDINENYPGMVEGISQHEGVSFVLIH